MRGTGMAQESRVRDRWKQALAELERDCPWAGPRPLTRSMDGSARYRFIERETDAKQFLDVVRSNRLIVLHGESGAGKSSLLDMVLIDQLFDNGFAVLPCRAWGRLGDRDPEEFLADEYLHSDLLHPEVVEQLEQGGRLVGALDDLYDGEAVIILDQFEELIRNRRSGDVDRMTSWILQVNKSNRTKVVISLRSEYLHRLTGALMLLVSRTGFQAKLATVHVLPHHHLELETHLGDVIDIDDIDELHHVLNSIDRDQAS